MTVKRLTEHHLELLRLKGGCTGSSESTHVKMPHCWKSLVTAQLQQRGCASREDSDQPRQQLSLVRVLAVHMKRVWVLS